MTVIFNQEETRLIARVNLSVFWGINKKGERQYCHSPFF